MIQRFHSEDISVEADGAFVRYEDHIAALAAARASKHPIAQTCPRCDGSLMPETERGRTWLRCRQCTYSTKDQGCS